MKILKGFLTSIVTFLLLFPCSALAAGGGGTALVVVADTRRAAGGIEQYFSNLYNTNILLFAVWAVVLTAAWGCLLGGVMDIIMSKSGLDLKSRKLVEH